MENCGNCQGNGSVGAVFKTVSVVLLLVIAGLLGYLAYNQFAEKKLLEDSYVEYEKTPTIEDAMYEWNEQKESAREYAVYINLPAPIIQALYEKLGTQRNVSDYVKEYELNEQAYISKYISESADVTVDKSIADKIDKVEVKAKLKEPESLTEKVSLTPGIPEDSIK